MKVDALGTPHSSSTWHNKYYSNWDKLEFADEMLGPDDSTATLSPLLRGTYVEQVDTGAIANILLFDSEGVTGFKADNYGNNCYFENSIIIYTGWTCSNGKVIITNKSNNSYFDFKKNEEETKVIELTIDG